MKFEEELISQYIIKLKLLSNYLLIMEMKRYLCYRIRNLIVNKEQYYPKLNPHIIITFFAKIINDIVA